MAKNTDDTERTQQSQPKWQQTKPQKGEPATIPVPKRSEFDRLLDKAEKPPKKS